MVLTMQTGKVVRSLESVIPANRAIRTFTIIAPLFAAVIVGTGGGYSATSIGAAVNSLTRTALVPTASFVAKEASEVPDVTVACLLQIRDAFGLNMTELAIILGVSRPAVYAWFRGAKPKKEVTDALWSLQAAADEFKSIPTRNTRALLRRPILDGQSLFAILTSQKNVLKGVRELARQLSAGKVVTSLRASSEATSPKRRIYSAEEISMTVID